MKIQTKLWLGLQNLDILSLQNNKIEVLYQHTWKWHGLRKLTVLHLHSNWIKTVPKNAWHGLKTLNLLNLQNNIINKISRGAWSTLSKLTILYLQNNRIQKIQRYTWHGLDSLIFLSLDGNYIESFHGETFLWTPHLQHLHMKNNKLVNKGLHVRLLGSTKATEDLYKDDWYVETLDLQQNNLTTVNKGMFKGALRLKHLHLDMNNIYEIEKDALCSSIFQNITLKYNRLTHIKRNTFEEQNELRSLDMSFNKIFKIQKGTFKTLTAIYFIGLTGNKLKVVSSNMFNKLSTKHLQNSLILKLDDNQIDKVVNGSYFSTNWMIMKY